MSYICITFLQTDKLFITGIITITLHIHTLHLYERFTQNFSGG